MASPEARRKGLRAVTRVLLPAVLAGAAMIPVALIVGAILAPGLWKLERMLGIELAGHSGPASWVYLSIWAVLTASVTLSVLAVRRRS